MVPVLGKVQHEAGARQLAAIQHIFCMQGRYCPIHVLAEVMISYAFCWIHHVCTQGDRAQLSGLTKPDAGGTCRNDSSIFAGPTFGPRVGDDVGTVFGYFEAANP